MTVTDKQVEWVATKPNSDLYIVPIPIRPDMVAQLQIPRDLTAKEAKKIARVVIALG